MHSRRNTALMELKRLAIELRNSKIVSSDRTLIEELGQTCTWASNAGTRSNMAEIQERIGSIKSKVRVQLIHSLRFMPLTHLACLCFGRNQNSGLSCWIHFSLPLFRMKPCRSTWHRFKLGLIGMDKKLLWTNFHKFWMTPGIRLVNMRFIVWE